VPTTEPCSSTGPEVVRCEVRAAGVATRYARAGSGRPVLVLGLSDGTELHPLARELGRDLRVIAPERWSGPGGYAGDRPPLPLAAWLGPFLEGLGVPNVTLVASSELAFPALAFALGETARVDGLVLVHDGVAPSAAIPEGSPDTFPDTHPDTFSERLLPSRLPLLLVGTPAHATPGSAAGVIVRFLEGGGADLP
jgi:pimeloyl-ACP methyl ester carboxylesterase